MKDAYNALQPARQPGPFMPLLGGRVEQYYALNADVPVSGSGGNGKARLWAEPLKAQIRPAIRKSCSLTAKVTDGSTVNRQCFHAESVKAASPTSAPCSTTDSCAPPPSGSSSSRAFTRHSGRFLKASKSRVGRVHRRKFSSWSTTPGRRNMSSCRTPCIGCFTMASVSPRSICLRVASRCCARSERNGSSLGYPNKRRETCSLG